MADDASPLGSLPSWAKSVLYVGAPTVAAGWLIFWLTGNVQSRLTAIESALSDNAKLSVAVTEHLKAEDERAWTTLGTLQKICIELAKSDADRIDCISHSAVSGGNR